MGLPCVHMIREMNCEALPLNNIHEQWRIDTRSFDQGESLDDGDGIDVLLFELKTKYDTMPHTQKENTKRQLTQFLGAGASLPLILEPNVQPHKGRPSGSKNKKGSSSTKREPSSLEMKEQKSRKCSLCQGTGHNCRTCPLNDEAPEASLHMPSKTTHVSFVFNHSLNHLTLTMDR